MTCPEGIVVLIGQLYNRAAELRKILVYKVSELVTGKDGLFLKHADITPGVYHLSIHIPIRSIAEKIGVVVKEPRRTYDLPVACAFYIHHLSGLCAHEDDKTIRLLLLLGRGRNDRNKGTYEQQESLH